MNTYRYPIPIDIHIHIHTCTDIHTYRDTCSKKNRDYQDLPILLVRVPCCIVTEYTKSVSGVFEGTRALGRTRVYSDVFGRARTCSGVFQRTRGFRAHSSVCASTRSAIAYRGCNGCSIF